MTFHEEKLVEFHRLFQDVRERIAGFPGCKCLKIYADVSDKTVIFTYSEWTSEEHLNTYRESDLFRATWTETKKYFKAAPEAWSLSDLT